MTGNKLKLDKDRSEALLAGFRRKFSVSQDNHLTVCNRDIFFKVHVKNIGVYIDATLW